MMYKKSKKVNHFKHIYFAKIYKKHGKIIRLIKNKVTRPGEQSLVPNYFLGINYLAKYIEDNFTSTTGVSKELASLVEDLVSGRYWREQYKTINDVVIDTHPSFFKDFLRSKKLYEKVSSCTNKRAAINEWLVEREIEKILK